MQRFYDKRPYSVRAVLTAVALAIIGLVALPFSRSVASVFFFFSAAALGICMWQQKIVISYLLYSRTRKEQESEEEDATEKGEDKGSRNGEGASFP